MRDRYCFAFLRNNRLFLGFTFFRFFFIQFSRYTWRWAFRVLGSSRFLSTNLPSLLVFGCAFLISSYNVREMPPVQPVVGSSGLEPPTSRLSGVRSNHLSYEPMSVAVRGPAIPAYLLSVVTLLFALSPFSRRSHCVAALFFRLNASYSVREMLGASRGGDEQNRTVDPLLARQVLSQLSYTPMLFTGRRLHSVKVPCETLKIKQCAELKVLPTDVNVCLTLDYVLSNMSP